MKNSLTILALLLGLTIHPADLNELEQRLSQQIDKGLPQSLALLEQVVNMNSGSMNLAGVRAVGRVFQSEFDALGFDTTKEARPAPEMSDDEEKIYNLILNSPATKDKIISELNIETGELNSLISLMEIKGILKETMGEIRLVD